MGGRGREACNQPNSAQTHTFAGDPCHIIQLLCSSWWQPSEHVVENCARTRIQQAFAGTVLTSKALDTLHHPRQQTSKVEASCPSSLGGQGVV